MKKNILHAVAVALMFLGAMSILRQMTQLIFRAIELNSTADVSKDTTVFAKTWVWAVIVSEPIPVTNSDAPNGHDNIGLMQLEFRVSDYGVQTAFVNGGQTAGFVSPLPAAGGHWEKGDEVLIASIPGKIMTKSVGIQPTLTYMVINYRSASVKKP